MNENKMLGNCCSRLLCPVFDRELVQTIILHRLKRIEDILVKAQAKMSLNDFRI